MTLHGAIEKLLRETGRAMTTTEIANELNKNEWYKKKDGSTIMPFQIHGRTRNYPQLFNRKGSIVLLNEQPDQNSSISKKQIKKPHLTTSIIPNDMNVLEKILMNEEHFKSAAIIDNLVPNSPGLYCIRIKDINSLPTPLDKIIEERNHNIIYIGIASQSLKKRFVNQELRAKGHGSFFRSIGAILSYKPPKGSLKDKVNKRNFKFSPFDEHKIINWINENLIVNWIEYNGDINTLENELVQKYLPLLNLDKNPLALKGLLDLRAECVEVANS